MNTPPDETTLTLWMDGLLEGEELQHMEAWAQEHPELLAERDAIQALSQNIQQNIPKSIEPPYPDFFNQRIIAAIQEDTPVSEAQQSNGGFWRWLAAPLAAGAMALCFYLGTQFTTGAANPVGKSIASSSTVYTPDNGVQADIFVNENQDATVIVIEGLTDIPDELNMVGGPSTDDPNKVMVSTEYVY